MNSCSIIFSQKLLHNLIKFLNNYLLLFDIFSQPFSIRFTLSKLLPLLFQLLEKLPIYLIIHTYFEPPVLKPSLLIVIYPFLMIVSIFENLSYHYHLPFIIPFYNYNIIILMIFYPTLL